MVLKNCHDGRIDLVGFDWAVKLVVLVAVGRL